MQKQCHLCERSDVIARGLCHRCYQRLLWRKKNNPDTWGGWPFRRERLELGDECAYCTGEPYARDLCRKHYRRLSRRGLLEVRVTEGSRR